VKSMWQDATQREMAERLARLTPDAAAQWGRMTAPRMVAHLTQSFKSAVGELRVAPKNSALRYWLPFPKNVPTAPEMLALEPTEWVADVANLQDLMRRFAAKEPSSAWPDHAAFGRLSGKQWGILMYRHADHHFRQFGV
jgi:hypothetical protein